MASVREGVKRLEQLRLVEVAPRRRDARARLARAAAGSTCSSTRAEHVDPALVARGVRGAPAAARRGRARWPPSAARDEQALRCSPARRRARRRATDDATAQGLDLAFMATVIEAAGQPRLLADRQLDPRPVPRAPRAASARSSIDREELVRHYRRAARGDRRPASRRARARRCRVARRRAGGAAAGRRVTVTGRCTAARGRRSSPRSPTPSPRPSRRCRPWRRPTRSPPSTRWLAAAPRASTALALRGALLLERAPAARSRRPRRRRPLRARALARAVPQLAEALRAACRQLPRRGRVMARSATTPRRYVRRPARAMRALGQRRRRWRDDRGRPRRSPASAGCAPTSA